MIVAWALACSRCSGITRTSGDIDGYWTEQSVGAEVIRLQQSLSPELAASLRKLLNAGENSLTNLIAFSLFNAAVDPLVAEDHKSTDMPQAQVSSRRSQPYSRQPHGQGSATSTTYGTKVYPEWLKRFRGVK